MRRFQILAIVGVVSAVLAVALWSSGPAYAFRGFKGDLGALPGCAGQCHVKGGFFIDPHTGRKHFTGGGGGGGGRTVCTERIARGPVFSQRQRICCDEAGHCKTTNLGAIGNEGASPAAGCKARCMQQSDHCNAMNGGVQSINGCGIKREICLSKC